MIPTIVAAVILAIIRVWIGMTVAPSNATLVDVYKDIAHLFIGGLFVGWCYQRSSWQWRLFWLMSGLEVAVAVMSRM